MRKIKLYLFMMSISTWLVASGCTLSARIKTVDTVKLPFLKNSAEECYFLDEFMPTPSRMVTGQSGSLGLRYYSYAAADYKDWEEQQVVLSFYSRDRKCWSLFEEYFVKE